MRQHKVVLLLGGNLGDVRATFKEAEKLISDNIGPIKNASSLYQTAAWGLQDQPDFLNKIIVISSPHTAMHIMNTCLAIEKKLGRVRGEKNAARTIDIDILFYDKEIINEPDLLVPHPRMAQRKFVLKPLNEIMPAFKHPVTGQSMHHMLLQCTDTLPVHKI